MYQKSHSCLMIIVLFLGGESDQLLQNNVNVTEYVQDQLSQNLHETQDVRPAGENNLKKTVSAHLT